MKITFTGRQTAVRASLKKFTEEKIRKLERIFGEIIEAHVILAATRHRFKAEIQLHARALSFNGLAEATEARPAMHAALEKIEKQARRYKDKRTVRRKRVVKKIETVDPAVAAEQTRETPQVVITSDGFRKKPLSVDEAALQMQESERGFLVFRNADTLQISVIYKRKDGNFGLIEPEK
jgi:putative sigma-54 modulation protein